MVVYLLTCLYSFLRHKLLSFGGYETQRVFQQEK
jgi:hypothetical protein